VRLIPRREPTLRSGMRRRGAVSEYSGIEPPGARRVRAPHPALFAAMPTGCASATSRLPNDKRRPRSKSAPAKLKKWSCVAFEPPFAKEGLAALFDRGRQGGVDHVVVVDVDLVVQPPGRVGQPTVVIADFGQYPALVALAADEGLAGFVLRRQRI